MMLISTTQTKLKYGIREELSFWLPEERKMKTIIQYRTPAFSNWSLEELSLYFNAYNYEIALNPKDLVVYVTEITKDV